MTTVLTLIVCVFCAIIIAACVDCIEQAKS